MGKRLLEPIQTVCGSLHEGIVLKEHQRQFEESRAILICDIPDAVM